MTVTGCTFSGNSAGNGGAIYVKSTTTDESIISDCIFSKNSSGEDGAAILADHNITISRCTFDQNSTARYGTFGSRGNNAAVFINCVFSKNSTKFGGGICLNGGGSTITGTITVMNCTFTGNTLLSGGKGGAIYTLNNGNSSSIFTITNSIFWNNGGNAIDRSGTTQLLPEVSYTDIDQSGYAGSIGNITGNPLFAGPSDYHLQAGSPCIDNGTSAAAPSTDIEGTSRPQGANFDMGAYEYYWTPFTTTTTSVSTSSTTTSNATTTTTIAASTTTVVSTTSSMPATTTTTSTKAKLCPAETVFENEPAKLDLLRRFRDGVLSNTPEGRRWTAFYYGHAELIAGLLEKSPALKRQSRAAVERLLPYIGLLVNDKAVDPRAMRRDARALIGLFERKSAMELKTSLRHMLE